MSLPKKLAAFLKKNKVPYEIVEHPATFTSQETAQATHMPGARVAKAVMVNAKKGHDERDLMLVLPADHRVDLLKLQVLLDARQLRVEEESEFEHLFPDAETGAMPPFGELYEIPCLVDQSLLNGQWVAFNAGNHRECLRVRTDDFTRVLKAQKGDFSVLGTALPAGNT